MAWRVRGTSGVMEQLNWINSPFPSPPAGQIDRSLIDALLDCVMAGPDDVAVIDGAQRISFAELAARAGGIAAQLRQVDAPSGPVVAIQPMGVDMVATWFACAAAGRPLCLLDPHSPRERNRDLAAKAGAHVLLHNDLQGVLDMSGLIAVAPDGTADTLVGRPALALDAPLMIFPTSGSSGTPKLVAHSARTLQARIQASIRLMHVARGDRVLIASAHGNFGYIHHALTFLLAGGTLCLFDLPARGLGALASVLEDAAVGHVRFTPSLFRQAVRMPDVARGLRKLHGLRFSGEPLLWSDINAARAATDPACRIQNVYGSTESAIFLWTDERAAIPTMGAAPIGYPYPLWEYALSDATPQAAGHLVVRSRFQALGDWRNGAVDGGRFPSDATGCGLRCYETGDMVRMVDGQLVALERRDHLVKINGQRISLIEVADHLRRMPGCADAVAIVAHGALAAFVVAEPDQSLPASIRLWLLQRLPAHMVPGRIRIIAAMPLMAGGKVDLTALHRRLEVERDQSCITHARETDDEWRALKVLWAKALGRPGIEFEPTSDFFDCGGDSLRLLELRLALESGSYRGFHIDRFLERPTLAGLAGQLGLPSCPAPDGSVNDGPSKPLFRPVRRALGPSRGIALIMPGRSGAAVVHPWIAAEALPDHDLWACDIGWASGHMLQENRWIDAAEAIAAALRDDDAPHASILLGFSIAGYIGWLVDRLLAGTHTRPDTLILLDPAPMHRRRGLHRRRLAKLLARARPDQLPAMLLIRRSRAASAQLSDLARPDWNATDAIISDVAVGTVDHADIHTRAVLRASATAIQDHLSGSRATRLATVAPDSPSGQLHAMLVADAVTPEQIDNIMRRQAQFGSHGTLAATLFLAVSHGRIDQVRNAISAVANVAPQSSAHRLAALMLRWEERTGSDLITTGRLPVILDTTGSIKHAFGMRGRMAGRSKTDATIKIVLNALIAFQYLRMRINNQRYRVTQLIQKRRG